MRINRKQLVILVVISFFLTPTFIVLKNYKILQNANYLIFDILKYIFLIIGLVAVSILVYRIAMSDKK